jgi:proline racemase
VDNPVRGLEELQDQAKKSSGEKASSPESIRQPGASTDPEWMGLNNPDLGRIPMTIAYGGPTLIVDQVKPLMLMDPGNLVDVARVVVDTTAKLKEQNMDYVSLLKKQ